MELKDKLVSSFLAFDEQYQVGDDVHQIRSQAIKDFETIGFPSKKEEAWKYTSLQSTLKHDYSIFPKEENAIEYSQIKKVPYS